MSQSQHNHTVSSKSANIAHANIAQHAVLSSLNQSQLVLVNDVHLKEMRPLIGNKPIRYRHLYTGVNAVLRWDCTVC